MHKNVLLSPVQGSKFERLRYFGALLPFAVFWYVSRFIRQTFNIIYFKTIGKYAFRKVGKNVKIDGFPEILWPCANIVLGNNVRLGKRCVFQGSQNSSIIIGNKVTINDGCYITALCDIRIGDGTSIGEYTSIRDYNHKFDNVNTPIKEQNYYGAPIEIGSDCWIGRGCIILAGVKIGDGAVVGANSVVTKDVPSNSIYAGVPAKLIRTRGE